jgi:hypothetical protein
MTVPPLTSVSSSSPDADAGLGGSARWRVFSVLWATSVVFHVFNESSTYGLTHRVSARGVTHLALAVAALALIAVPDLVALWAVLAALIVVTAWMEAPVVGNHWIAATLVSLGFLGALATSVGRGRRIDRIRLEAGFVPTARAVLLVFYSFAALSKLNRAFVNPAVSCATFFTDELAHSLGIHQVATQNHHALSYLVPVVVIVIELSVPVLLVVRRTRMFGILLALGFHGLIGFDGSHPFADFTGLVYALVLLFAPEEFFVATVAAWRRRPASWRAGATAVVVASLGYVVAVQVLASSFPWLRFETHAKNALWRVITVVVVVVVGRFALRYRGRPERLTTVTGRRWLWVVPAVAVLNGLAPYLNLKTAYSWNMYSNLVTAPGRSNSYVLPSGIHLSAIQEDLVQVVSSTDGNLQGYADENYLLTWVTLRAYTASHPDTSLVYVRHGVTVTVTHTRRDPALSQPVPAWERRLFAFRAVDAGRPERCQPYFLAAG